MKVATFGCSWTHGHVTVDNHYNWPNGLQEIHPEWEIYNYALAGSSLSFQVQLMDRVLKHEKYDIIIFQFTSPGRLTYFEEDYDYLKYFTRYTSTYQMFDTSSDIYRKIFAICPGHMSLSKSDSFWTTPEKYQLAKLYYTHINKSIHKIEYKALTEYVKRKTDLCFFHNEDVLKLNIHPVINEEVKKSGGNELLKTFIADKGEHYNKVGAQWQANWVNNKLKENSII